jgi:biopolymer transport protein ExbD
VELKPRRARRARALNLTPLIDVLLLLLVFFMVTTTFVENPLVEFALPRVGEAPAGRLAPLVVGLDADGRIYLKGRPVDAAELTSALRVAIEASPEAALVLKAHRDVRYERVVEIVALASSLGFRKIQSPVATGHEPG